LDPTTISNGSGREAGRYRLIGGFLMAVFLLAAANVLSVDLLSAARAYVGGESLYSKAQKEAVSHLYAFLETQDAAQYRAFERELAVPLGDQAARLALDQPVPDEARVRAGFLQGGNHPDDIPGLIRLYRGFRHVDFMADAIDIWREADEEVQRLQELGADLHSLAASATLTPRQRDAAHAQIDAINSRLTLLEQRFSERLGEASRVTKDLLVVSTLAIAAALAGIAALFAKRTLDRLSASQSALRESNARWELAASAGQMGVFEWDLARDEVLVDRRVQSLYGWPEEPSRTMERERMHRLVHPDDRARLELVAERVRAGLGSIVERYRILRADGRTRHLEVYARLAARSDGAPGRMVGVVRDVTEREQSEELRRAKTAAEEASRAKSDFLTRVSHELRTPLNAVLGFARLMSSDARHRLDGVQSKRLGHVLDGANHLLRLVEDVLNLSHIERGSMRLHLERLNVEALVESTVHLMHPLAQAHRVTLDWHPAPGPGAVVRADRTRLEQVLVNVISNAIKYNRESGHADVALGLTPTMVTITVRDTGIGMSATQLAHLFEPFNRLGAERSGVDGVGLGLALSRQLVGLLGGTLEIDSAPGAGSVVHIELPRVADEPASVVALPRDIPDDTSEPPEGSVLYIEDNPVNALLVREFLQRWPGVRLLVAEDGESGIEAAREQRPDVILLDMQLPDMSGLQVLERLRKDAATQDLRVVVLSASAMPQQIDDAALRGAVGYLTKPIDFKRLATELRRRLAARPSVDS